MDGAPAPSEGAPEVLALASEADRVQLLQARDRDERRRRLIQQDREYSEDH